ncbi:hypothetical protein [Neobacillus jeddahensis]|uniref:hypothetical protein n=1 Tax=Neobacillus jeddahensis TaxID=1461580 RepID=UPI0005904F5F|nr:hypothetical protein [Neobacillus jeddahensis]
MKKTIHIYVSDSLRKSHNTEETQFQGIRAQRQMQKIKKGIHELSLTTISYIAADLGMETSDLLKEIEKFIE